MHPASHLRAIRIWLVFFMTGLVRSGVTAFPLEHETAWLVRFLAGHPILPDAMIQWISRVHSALYIQTIQAPFLAYGTDWLAFAHIVLAVAFLGPLIDPIRNVWVILVGLIACIGVLALALIAGPARAIPFSWRLIDCSFGIFGAIPLIAVLRHTKLLKRNLPASQTR